MESRGTRTPVKVKIAVETSLMNCDWEAEAEFDRDEWEGWSRERREKECQEAAEELLWQHVGYSWEVLGEDGDGS